MNKIFMKYFFLIGFFLLFFFEIKYANAAAVPKVCMVLDKGGQADHSFNQSAVNGFNRAKKELPIDKESKFVEPRDDRQIPQFFRAFAQQSGCNLIISIGFNNIPYLKDISNQFPHIKFLSIDATLESPKNNVRSIVFEEHEGSFVVGAIAALFTKTNKIGFIGGMDVPIIHRFAMGYTAGVKYINSKIQVVENYIGVTPDAWNNPPKAKELALAQYNKNVDVIYQVAAASGNGVFDAAEQLNKKMSSEVYKYFAIGVDSNQNWIKPGMILTSMVKKIDVSVFNTIQDLVNHKFTAGKYILNLKNSGVDWAIDKYNEKLFTPKMIEKINKIKKDIIAGFIKVPDYYEIKK